MKRKSSKLKSLQFGIMFIFNMHVSSLNNVFLGWEIIAFLAMLHMNYSVQACEAVS